MFVDGVTDTQKTVNDMSPHIPCGDKNVAKWCYLDSTRLRALCALLAIISGHVGLQHHCYWCTFHCCGMFSTQFNATKQLAHGAHRGRGHGSNNSHRQLSAFHRIHLHGRYALVVDAFPAENIIQSIHFRTTTSTIKWHR